MAVGAEMCQPQTSPSVIQQWCCSHFHGADISSCHFTSKMEVWYTFGRSPQSYGRKREAHSLRPMWGLTWFCHGNHTELPYEEETTPPKKTLNSAEETLLACNNNH